MAPKKDKGKNEDKLGGAFTEVERTFLELQLAEANRKIARLRTAVDEYEHRNEELQNAYDKLDEDRADIIAYLKKTLAVKNEENSELKEKVKGLEEIRQIETSQFKETVDELEKNFSMMKDQLTSENKLLAGKLNTLEEFRAIRDDLMRKFEKQEQDFKDQEMKYKRIIYDTEKKFIIGKDKLKKEMEARLLQLAQDFQDATELRIASSTLRLIRENIAINNELDNILTVQQKLADQNEKFKASSKSAHVAKELAEEERDKAINKNVVQLKVIEQLTAAFQDIKKEKALFEKRNFDFDTLQLKIQKLVQENDNLSLQVRILEQNLHAKLSEQNKAIAECSKVCKEREKLRTILKDAAFAIQAALKLDHWAQSDPTREAMDRQVLLARLLEIVSQYREIERAESISTMTSFTKVYQEGDLGFIPKPTSKKSAAITAISMQSKESLKPERCSPSVTLSTSSLGSVKTIPSLKLLPPSHEQDLKAKDSLQSFASSQSSEGSSKTESEKSEELTDIQKLLAASKLEIQRSIMKDLEYSHTGLISQSRMSEDKSKKKSVVILETIEDGDEQAKISEQVADEEKKLVEKEEEQAGEKPSEPEQDQKKGLAEDEKPKDADIAD